MAHGKANQGVERRQRISFFALGAAEEVVRCQSRRNDQRTKVVRRGVRRENQRSEEHTSELQSRSDLVCRLLLEKKTNRTHFIRARHLTLHSHAHLLRS